jgi:hypothetical protein
VALQYNQDEETIKQAIKEQMTDQYSDEELKEVMKLFDEPIDDDELDEFDNELEYLIDESDEDYIWGFSDLGHDIIFFEASINLFGLFSMLLLKFSH